MVIAYINNFKSHITPETAVLLGIHDKQKTNKQDEIDMPKVNPKRMLG